MARHVFQRDFSLCKAGLLGGLIVLAGILQGKDTRTANLHSQTDLVVPVATLMLVIWKDCEDDTSLPEAIDL